ncbi:MAG: argininosuccinate synthase domain-containing protein [Pyrinomonadaceae bacterium]
MICYCADVGQGEELDWPRREGQADGASQLFVKDLRDEFVREYVWTAVERQRFV